MVAEPSEQDRSDSSMIQDELPAGSLKVTSVEAFQRSLSSSPTMELLKSKQEPLAYY